MRLSVLVRLATAVALAGSFQFAAGQAPTALTVPFVASNSSAPHTSWSGNQVTLKGSFTSPLLGTDTFTWDWDPGDGGQHCTGTVNSTYVTSTSGIAGDQNNPYVIGCTHTYTGTQGTVYTAILTVTDTTNGQVAPAASNCPIGVSAGACYYTSLNAPPPNLPVEVNNAIDNGLWYLHAHMNRYTNGSGLFLGDWNGGVAANADANAAGGTGVSASNCAAFENSGFLQNNTPLNMYSTTVQLCLSGVFDQLQTISISSFTPQGFSQFNPDSNGNGIAVQSNGNPYGYTNYNTGMVMDALVAANTPTLAIPSNTALANANPGGGTGTGGVYTYKDALYDMVDAYSYCMNPGAPDEGFGATPSGGWHYTCQDTGGDNSISQWAAIGIIPARRKVALPLGQDPLNSEVLATDQSWLTQSFTNNGTNGYFGYTSGSPLWGPFADTPSGLVQLAMSGLGRGTTVPGGADYWDLSETYLRDTFGDTGGDPTFSGYPYLKSYYYGMYSFTKSMLLHDNNDVVNGKNIGTGMNVSPITLLQSMDDPNSCALPVPEYKTTPGDSGPGTGTGPCYPPIDWYGAQSAANGGTDPTDGVARTLISTQGSDGSWYGHNASSEQYYIETGIAVTMLNKTVFQQVPVACFTVNPAQVAENANGVQVILDASCSVDQDTSHQIVTYEWDVDGTGGTNFTIGTGIASSVGTPGTVGYATCLTSSCSKVSLNVAAPSTTTPLPYNYPIRLEVANNATPPLTASVLNNAVVAYPPNPPDANAGGPYNFCPNVNGNGQPIYAPFTVSAALSTNPDQGKDDGYPGDNPSTISSYIWDLSGSCSDFSGTGAPTDPTSVSGVQIDATSVYDQSGFYGKTFPVCVQVTNTDNNAFCHTIQASGGSCSTLYQSVGSAQVSIHNPTDEVCTHCVNSLTSLAKAGTPLAPANIQLYWTDTNTSVTAQIDHYNIYRSTSATFIPYQQIAGANSVTGNRGVPVSNPPGGQLYYNDTYQLTSGATYYYRVAPATANDTETCQGNKSFGVTIPASKK